MEYTGQDFYCDVALTDDAVLDVEYESEQVLAFHHTKPHWPVHIVVIPKKHISSLTTVALEDAPIIKEMLGVIQSIARSVEEKEGAARIVTNLGMYQDSKHFHVHISSGESLR